MEVGLAGCHALWDSTPAGPRLGEGTLRNHPALADNAWLPLVMKSGASFAILSLWRQSLHFLFCPKTSYLLKPIIFSNRSDKILRKQPSSQENFTWNLKLSFVFSTPVCSCAHKSWTITTNLICVDNNWVTEKWLQFIFLQSLHVSSTETRIYDFTFFFSG